MDETEKISEEMQNWEALEQEKPDHLPTPEQLHSIFEQLAKGREYTETRKLEDENGVTLWEIEFSRPEQDDVVEFSYRRPKQDGDPIEIDVTIYEDGMPVNGDKAAFFINGKWEINDSWDKHVVDETLMQKPEKKLQESGKELTREAEGEIESLESLMDDFEKTYSLDELLGLVNMTREEAESHPVRKPAKMDLTRIRQLLDVLKAETDITYEQSNNLEARYQVLSKAVGRQTNKNIIVHE